MDRMHFNNFNLFIATRTLQSASIDQHGGAICYRYGSQETTVVVHIATSLISPEQAAYNLDSELTGRSFDDIKEETRIVWNRSASSLSLTSSSPSSPSPLALRILNRVEVIDSGPVTAESTKSLITFYTGLYRALMFPRRLGEPSPSSLCLSLLTLPDEKDRQSGEMVHFSPYDPNGGVHKGPLVTDNGFWDTFRTVYPLLGLAYRGELGTSSSFPLSFSPLSPSPTLGFIVEGWLNAYREGGWLPSWASPGYRNCMVGTYADVVIADAIVKDIKGFDLETARAALKKDAFEDPPAHAGSAVGKEGLREYSQNGFMSSAGNAESVSRSLDFGFADYATARAFQHLQHQEEYLVRNRAHETELREDATKLDSRWQRAVKGCFSPTHGLMAPKGRGGGVAQSFDPVEWGNGFVEGNSWHHSFPPYALKELAQLYGNDKKLLNKLHELLSTTSDFRSLPLCLLLF
jgi:putative alpha-1,2-mannosidase